jgi:hypothetical protein
MASGVFRIFQLGPFGVGSATCGKTGIPRHAAIDKRLGTDGSMLLRWGLLIGLPFKPWPEATA